MEDMKYGFKVRLTGITCEEAADRVRESLALEGFGVLTEIDVQAALKEKIDVDFRKYTILGACNPVLAHRALTIDPDIGLMLPCNIVIEDDGGEVAVSAVSPAGVFGIVDSPEMAPVVTEAETRLRRVLEQLASGS